MKTYTFKSDKVRNKFVVQSDCVQDAANEAKKRFGGIIARRLYGKRGFVYLYNIISGGSESMRVQAFMGLPTNNGCSGSNVIYDVDLIDSEA